MAFVSGLSVVTRVGMRKHLSVSFPWRKSATRVASSRVRMMATGSSLKDEVTETINRSDVVVFATSTCPYCARLRGLFSELNIPSTVIEFDKVSNGNAMRAELAKLSGQTSVPNVFIGGKHIGGCDDTFEALEKGTLESMLKDVGITLA